MDVAASLNTTRLYQAAFSAIATLHITASNYPTQACLEDNSKFDFIIIGAGTAGSVIANRLTEDGTVNVLLVEAGGDPTLESELPGLLNFLKNSSVDWQSVTTPDGFSSQCKKNQINDITRGKMLGGSSSINYMVYQRGFPYDYQNWATISKDSSWDWDYVLPYFLISENLTDAKILGSRFGKYHNTKGPIKSKRYYTESLKGYFEAFQEMGENVLLDLNADTVLGYGEPVFLIYDGIRQSTAQCYLKPIKTRANLFVTKETLATKLLIDDNKNVYGVEILTKDNTSMKMLAAKEVIVSAGTVGSAQLLMLSGIGPKHYLEDLGIKVHANLPVGQNLQDHVASLLLFKMDKVNVDCSPEPTNYKEFPISHLIGFGALNKTQSYPDYQITGHILNSDSFISDCATYMDYICETIYKKVKGYNVFRAHLALSYPHSKGEVYINSGDPKDQPVIKTKYYSNKDDIENHLNYIKDFLRIVNTSYFKSIKAELIDPEIKNCADFQFGSDDYWRCYIVCMATTNAHSTGTCAMGSVVDSRLRVYDVNRLRVVDASIMPVIVGANTNSPVTMCAEKVADLIKEDNYMFK